MCSALIVSSRSDSGVSKIPHKDMENYTETEKVAYYEDLYYQIQRVWNGVAQGLRDSLPWPIK